MQGFNSYHNPQKIGCSSCHLGNTHSESKEVAHQNMVKIPGNLANASKTCSSTNCHKGELERVNKSLMTTNSGIVSIDKYAFGEIPHTDTFLHIKNIKTSAADRHLKNLCFKCHLGYEKKHYAKVSQLSRGGGCIACHLDYKQNKTPDIKDNYHPSVNLNITNEKCFGCHSRSTRIATNYEGWYETLHTKDDINNKSGFRILEDGRIFAKNIDDVHHKAGMSCIDCHTSQEIMGDNKTYLHENKAVKLQCEDCHPLSKFNSLPLNQLDTISIMDLSLRQYKNKRANFIFTQKDSMPLVNTEVVDSITAFLEGKLNHKTYKLNIISSNCKDDKAHKNLSCTMCHTAWAPTCIGCHTAYNPDVKLVGGHRGKWYEEVDDFGAKIPVMAMVKTGKRYKIKPAIPGMIMTLDKSRFKGKKAGDDFVFHRWFAPVSAHTVTKDARSCESCHLNPYAIGYGSGKLNIKTKNGLTKWTFEPEYENNENDNLPEDAWIGFMKNINKNKKYSAHSGVSPLNLKIQKRILQVGSCLKCHKKQKFKKQMTSGTYVEMLENRTTQCLISD